MIHKVEEKKYIVFFIIVWLKLLKFLQSDPEEETEQWAKIMKKVCFLPD